MDIRSAFRKQQIESDKKKAQKRSSVPVIIDDDDGDFKQNNKRTKSQKNKRNKIKYELDSDDEEVLPPPEKSPKLSSAVASSSKSSSKSSKVKNVSVTSFFGCEPIKRSSKDTTSSKTATSTSTKIADKQSKSEPISESPFGSPISKTTKSSPLKESKGIENKRSCSDLAPPAKKLKLLIDKSKAAEEILRVSKSITPSPHKQFPSQVTPTKQSAIKSPARSKSKSKTPEIEFKEEKHKHEIISIKKQLHISPSASRHGTRKEIKEEKKRESECITSPTGSGPPKLSNASSYQAYLNRGGPKAPGSKEIPQGASNCLAGLTFVFTGVGESMDKDESTEVAKRYGAKVTSAVSGKTTYLVCGEGAGESKISKAEKIKVKIIDEDEFLELIRTRPAGKHASTPSSITGKRKGKRPSSGSKNADQAFASTSTAGMEAESQSIKVESQFKVESQLEASLTPSRNIAFKAGDDHNCSLMLVDKYSPVATNQIIGQKGDKSNVKKLAKWLREWFDYHGVAPTKKPVYSSGRSADGSSFKSALLSGPPGIGKTTSATLVCKEEGFTYTELNASSCRGKKALQTEVAASMGSLSMNAFIEGGGGLEAGKRHVLIMDEVDGMAGNEDRGGVQELIKLIKKSSIPVICICNNRQHMKIKSLANYCYDLRFTKPKVEQIKGSMMSIAYKEGIRINPQALQEIIIASNNDIRQVLHNLSLWAAMDKTVTLNEAMKSAKKERKMGPFDVVKSVFLPIEGERELSLNEKASLFFHDYSFGPLFVQENYLRVKPVNPSNNTYELLQAVSNASDAIANGDLVSKLIRSEQNWGLLPIQAMYSSVLPGEYMRGTMGQPHFPQWLGNNSKQGKFNRILQELQQHTRLVCSCDRTEFGMEYLPILHDCLTRPLLEKGGDGVPEVISCLESYNMTREDWDSVVELSQYSGRNDVMAGLSSKTKAAFTRAYNKSNHTLPYSIGGVKKKPVKQSVTEADDQQAAVLQEEGEDDSGLSDRGTDSEDDQKKMAEKYLKKTKKQTESRAKGKKKSSS